MREGSKPDRAETGGLGVREPDPRLAATGEGRAHLSSKTPRLRQGTMPTLRNVVTCRGMSRPVVPRRALSRAFLRCQSTDRDLDQVGETGSVAVARKRLLW